MPSASSLLFLGPDGSDVGTRVSRFCEEHELGYLCLDTEEEVRSLMNRALPACVVMDARVEQERMLTLCRELKSDAFTAIVPVVICVEPKGGEGAAEALAAGADEVLTADTSDREVNLRLELVLRRAARDVAVHPTTRLPGTVMIERDIAERLEAGGAFAVCYADLDHFKEFNDRYGYGSGDRVILLLSKILRDIVRAHAPDGFVGHIGGDDFIFNVQMEHLEDCGDDIIKLFDELIPYQYTEEDRRAGYFMGKDRRGQVHRIPLMTLSIGVVTNQSGFFSHPGQVSELAAEMKSYAKSLPGSKYVVDRRTIREADEAKNAPRNSPSVRKNNAE